MPDPLQPMEAIRHPFAVGSRTGGRRPGDGKAFEQALGGQEGAGGNPGTDDRPAGKASDHPIARLLQLQQRNSRQANGAIAQHVDVFA